MRDLSIVTGASRGIGKAIALKLASENHNVMIFGRDNDALKKVKEEIGIYKVECDLFIGDVGDSDFVIESVKQILNKYGKVDHLINNAGFGIFKKVVESTLDEFKSQIDTNLFGVYNFTKTVLPSMIQRKSGSIINISSLAGKNAFVGGTMYSASKHALMGFTKSLMLEVREYNIRTVAICPGSVSTEFFATASYETNNLERVLYSEDIADVVSAVIKLPVRALVSELDIRPTNP